jgi:hypothetical protein
VKPSRAQQLDRSNLLIYANSLQEVFCSRGGNPLNSGREIGTELSVLVALAALTRLFWLFMVPMKEAPDEYCHFWMCNFLSQHLRLPVAAEVHAGGMEAVYGSLPQLGYLPHIVAAKVLPMCDLPLAFRFGSLAMGLVAIAGAYFIARQLFAGNRVARWALPLLMVFQPQLVLVHSYTNNDSTASALGAVILLILVLIVKRGISIYRSLALGFFLGWLALCKYAAYSLFFGAAFALLGAAWLNGCAIVFLIKNLALVFTVCALTCGWWFVRELNEYPGDLLGINTMYHTWAVQFNKPLNYSENIWHVIKDLPRWRMAVDSFWGVFGYMTRYLWRPIYFVYFAFVMLATIGGAFKLFDLKSGYRLIKDNLKWKETQHIEPVAKEKLEYAVILCTFAICVVVNLAAMTYSASKSLGGLQGRYLFSSEVPILALIIAGLFALSSKYGKCLVIALVVFNAIVYGVAFAMLYPEYGFHLQPL